VDPSVAGTDPVDVPIRHADSMDGPFGVYVHVPFCAARCDYCAFATWTDRDALMDSYAAACVDEARRAIAEEDLPPASSVYVGGGTPSRLPAELLAEILDAVVRRPGAEVTVECNPEDASAARFARWRAAGVNRVSFGVQSMVPRVLASLGRRHGTSQVSEAVALAGAAGFASVNVDLIVGAARETDGDLAATLDAVLALEPRPDHVSAYALTVEPGTALFSQPQRHPDQDVSARRYRLVDAALSQAGYRWYEVSNWARPGHECRHHTLYWAHGDYRGVGAAAHSHRGRRRWWNIRRPERYIAAVRSGACPTAGEEVLSDEQWMFEELVLALRTSNGVPTDAVPDDPDLEGLVERRDGRAVLTVSGRLLANEVAVRLRVPDSLVST
jgi:putative oxygen-independent coproporphyrinogen III oxidase